VSSSATFPPAPRCWQPFKSSSSCLLARHEAEHHVTLTFPIFYTILSYLNEALVAASSFPCVSMERQMYQRSPPRQRARVSLSDTFSSPSEQPSEYENNPQTKSEKKFSCTSSHCSSPRSHTVTQEGEKRSPPLRFMLLYCSIRNRKFTC
jgi:hypothetical protein